MANGDHRRVEDLRTEDFISSAEKSSDLQLADSTVVKILNTTTFENCVVITFSYDKNQSKIDIEATNEQPFFIYGQGKFNTFMFDELNTNHISYQDGQVAILRVHKKYSD